MSTYRATGISPFAGPGHGDRIVFSAGPDGTVKRGGYGWYLEVEGRPHPRLHGLRDMVDLIAALEGEDQERKRTALPS